MFHVEQRNYVLPSRQQQMKEFYYLSHSNLAQGPHNLAELSELMAQGKINPTTLIARKGDNSWEPLGAVLSQEQGGGAEQVPPPPPSHCPTCGYNLSSLTTSGEQAAYCPSCGHALQSSARVSGIWANYRQAMRRYAQFQGRATRAEFWSFQFINTLIFFLLYLILIIGMLSIIGVDQLASAQSEESVDLLLMNELEGEQGVALSFAILLPVLGMAIWALICIIPQLSVTVRRLHDANWSAWWFLPAPALMVLHFGLQIGMAFNLVTPSQINISSLGGIALVIGLYSLFLLVLCLQDSCRGTNAYGPSTKYPLR